MKFEQNFFLNVLETEKQKVVFPCVEYYLVFKKKHHSDEHIMELSLEGMCQVKQARYTV